MVSVIETEVEVLTVVDVTVTVGILSNDEQNDVADGATRKAPTTTETRAHSSSLSPRASSATELAAANDSRSEPTYTRILNCSVSY